MLKTRNNTNYAPFKICDLIARNTTPGCTDLLDNNLFRDIGDEWLYYLDQTITYRYRELTPFDTNIITAYIYDNFKERVMLDKYSDEFYKWSESEDFNIYVEMVKNTISQTLISNREKYKKLYYSMIAEFNPLWNVDGTETTERELRQTGTVEDTKTGTETNAKTGDITIERTGTETDQKTGTESTARIGTETTDNTGTDATAHTGTDTTLTANTTYDSSTMYDKERTTDTLNTTDTTTHNTESELTLNTEDTTTHNTTDTLTHNTEDTTTHNTTDTLTHDTVNNNERDLLDKETIKVTRQGNIGVTTTTKLLTEFREYADFNFIGVVARDIVNSITFMTY